MRGHTNSESSLGELGDQDGRGGADKGDVFARLADSRNSMGGSGGPGRPKMVQKTGEPALLPFPPPTVPTLSAAPSWPSGCSTKHRSKHSSSGSSEWW